jgi:hypothetical protein
MNDQPTSVTVQELLRKGYTAFNARDIATILSIMHPAVEWANGMESGYVHGHEGVRAYRRHQWSLIDPYVEPPTFRTEADILAIHPPSGFLVGDEEFEYAFFRLGASVALAISGPGKVALDNIILVANRRGPE